MEKRVANSALTRIRVKSLYLDIRCSSYLTERNAVRRVSKDSRAAVDGTLFPEKRGASGLILSRHLIQVALRP
jgi:hypothetical protein